MQEERLTGFKRRPDEGRPPLVERNPLQRLAYPGLRGIPADDPRPPNLALLIDEIDDTEVGETLCGHFGDA